MVDVPLCHLMVSLVTLHYFHVMFTWKYRCMNYRIFYTDSTDVLNVGASLNTPRKELIFLAFHLEHVILIIMIKVSLYFSKCVQ